MAVEAGKRRGGVRISSERLDYELDRRGINQRQFADLLGMHDAALSRMRRTGRVSPQTLRRLTDGLLSIPLARGADMLVAEPERKVPA